MKFKIGDRVIILNKGAIRVGLEATKLLYGTIKDINLGNDWLHAIKVTVDGRSNPRSSNGYYYFSENELDHTMTNVEGEIEPLKSVYISSSRPFVYDPIHYLVEEYCKNDVKNTMELYAFMNNNYIRRVMPEIKNVIFNYPATIVFWSDNTKTVVKAQDGDIFDPEKGLAMAISKKALGNKGNYCNELRKWLPKEKETWQPTIMTEIVDGMQKLGEAMKKTFGVKAKKSCQTCKHSDGPINITCLSCDGNEHKHWTPKDETEAK